MTMGRSARKPGFVLLIVLVVLAVAGSVLAITAGHCCRQALAAGAAARALQVEWGSLSCRAVCLPRAEALLAGESARLGGPVSSVRRTVVLGGIRFDLVASDEQAKADVNLLEHRFGRDVASAKVADLQSPLRRALQVTLRPSGPDRNVVSRIPIGYTCPDQVFVFDHPQQLVPTGVRCESPMQRITCWGGGRLNFTRADPAAIRHVTAGLLNDEQVFSLCELVAQRPGCTLAEAMKHLGLELGKTELLKAALTDRSRCQALWVVARGSTRNWYRLYVDQLGDMENDSRRWSFQW